MNGIIPTWMNFACAAVAFGGTLLVVLASMERILGRPIPSLKYSKPVPKQRVFIVVPIFMIVALIGAILILQPMQTTRMCSHCSSPSFYQQVLMVVAFLVFAAGTAGGVGFLVFLIVWIGNSAYRASATLLLRFHSR
jgi:hypothetical protein